MCRIHRRRPLIFLFVSNFKLLFQKFYLCTIPFRRTGHTFFVFHFLCSRKPQKQSQQVLEERKRAKKRRNKSFTGIEFLFCLRECYLYQFSNRVFLFRPFDTIALEECLLSFRERERESERVARDGRSSPCITISII